MMRRVLLLVFVGLIAALAGLLSYRWWSAVPPPALPEPMLVDLDGRAHALADWRGKVIVLNFWATWCPPCREEMPAFAELQQSLGDKGLQMIGVAMDDPADVRGYLAEHPVNYPILVGDASVPAWADSLGNEIAALPFSVVLDRQGQVRYAHTGVFRREQVLEHVMPLLGESQ